MGPAMAAYCGQPVDCSQTFGFIFPSCSVSLYTNLAWRRRVSQDFEHRPAMIRQPSRLGGCPLPEASTSQAVYQRLSQGYMRPHKVVRSPPPVEMQGEFAQRMRHAPGTACQSGNRPTDRKIEALDEGVLDPPRQTLRLQSLAIVIGRPKTDVLPNLSETAPLKAFDDLTVE